MEGLLVWTFQFQFNYALINILGYRLKVNIPLNKLFIPSILSKLFTNIITNIIKCLQDMKDRFK